MKLRPMLAWLNDCLQMPRLCVASLAVRNLWLALAVVLGGCSDGRTVSANLTGYNHTNRTIAAFYVNGVWGGNVTPHAGGGKFVCCAELPSPWHEGISVEVAWEDDKGAKHSEFVAVPRYEPKTLSRLNVHFMRNGSIKVFANRLALWHPDYPLKGKEAELEPGVPIEQVPPS